MPNFDTLRPWNGQQSRAFEELSFQLLKDQVPPGTRAIRTGNPDGGVEWYAKMPDGTECGWQAKYIKDIDALLTAMTDSVERVSKERPDLRKLIFVISSNLSTGKAGGQRKSQREKYEDKVATWQRTVPGASDINFELVQESDLLDELAKPKHEGRRWFWWEEVVLGHDWIEQRYKQQATAAGEKYRPDLQVDIPIQEDLLALGFDQTVVATFDRLRRRIIAAASDLRLFAKDEAGAALVRAVEDTTSSLVSELNALQLQAGDLPSTLEQLKQHLSTCRRAINAAADYDQELHEQWRNLPDGDPAKTKESPELTGVYDARKLRSSISELDSWLESLTGRCFQRRNYLLIGQAGSGKTHLLLDATRRALDAGRPAVFLAGAQFGRGDLWASITDQLGLSPVGSDVLLSAMDAAGEAASLVGARFVISIDALNETTPADFWRTHLPALRAAVAPYPHVALAVSCRDTYRDLVLEGEEGSHYICREHPVFAEREVEATQRYFAHYRLEAPKIPLLTPEFTLPLFLRMYCESLAELDPDSVPAGHQGRITIFERYLTAKVRRVARHFRPGASSAYELDAASATVRKVLDAVLGELSRLGREGLSTSAVEAIARSTLDSTDNATRIIGLLQEEGVLTRELLYLDNGKYSEGIRIVFQAFADFLLLKRRVDESSNPLDDHGLKIWLAEDCSWGIQEAATILFPEVYGAELPDYLGIKPTDEPDFHDDQADWDRHHRASLLYRSLVENLPYRETRSITKRTIELLNDAQIYLSRGELYSVLFTLAPQPGNPLNGEGLHRYLTQRSMPLRDSDFGFATYDQLFDASSPAARLARWAAAGPYPSYSAEVIELACIPLCWLMSSPNRFMRDWVTKALVQLLHGHLDVMRELVERFWTVDDPYVVQRVVVIAYGSLLRSTPVQADQAKALAELIHGHVFSRPIRPDELLLDAGRGVTRWAVAQALLPESALAPSQRPYGLKAPGHPPTEATIKAKYGWHKGQPDDESYSTILHSLLTLGDFGRYVVESGVRRFSRYRIGRDYPKREPRKPRVIKSRWQQFVNSLSDDQKEALADWVRDPLSASMSRWDYLFEREDDPLSEAQRELLDGAFVYRKPVDNQYPADTARRWVLQRTISLGWTPKLFGEKDHFISQRRSGREEHKSERWGKKYQWIAYHELLARIADNYQSSRTYGDDAAYDGLHQIIGDREIDSSLPPIDYRAFSDNGGVDTTAWGRPLVRVDVWPPGRLDFGSYRGEVRRFVADIDSEPRVSGSMFVRDRSGDDWVVLKGFTRQTDPLAINWRGLDQQTAIDTLLVPVGKADELIRALPSEAHNDAQSLLDADGHIDCCYVGEIGRTGPNCPHRTDELLAITIGDQTYQVAPTVEPYRWEGSILDCSIGESATTVLPSTFIQRTAHLSLDMRGPSWLDTEGVPIFTFYEEPGNDSYALLVRQAFLRDFLANQELELVVHHWFQRMKLSDIAERDPFIQSEADAWFGPDLALHEVAPRRTEYDGTTEFS